MVSTISNTRNIFSLILISICLFILIIGTIYYFVKTEDIISRFFSISFILVIIILSILGLFFVFKLTTNPLERKKIFSNIVYDSVPYLDSEGKVSEQKYLTTIGKIIEAPFATIKLMDKEGKIIKVKRIKDDLYQDEESGIYYDCILGDCKLSIKNKTKNKNT